jgi:hypothetical protein
MDVISVVKHLRILNASWLLRGIPSGSCNKLVDNLKPEFYYNTYIMTFRKLKCEKENTLYYSYFAFAITAYLIIDYKGPKSIVLRNDTTFGLECFRARDLVVQEYDSSGNLWATRGMIIYCLEKDGSRFDRIAHIPTGCTIYWLRNFSIIRKLTIRPECVELAVTGKGDFYALSAGRLWLMKSKENSQSCLSFFIIVLVIRASEMLVF